MYSNMRSIYIIYILRFTIYIIYNTINTYKRKRKVIKEKEKKGESVWVLMYMV
jgi:hypothetical protein